MRFIHTSDWHAGRKAAWAGASAPRVVQARIESFVKVGRLAAQHEAEFVLVAGDLFDSHEISLSTARETVEIIESFPCPVFIIPGNHDQDSPGSLWDRIDFSSLSRCRVLRSPSPVPLSGGFLYPCPLNSRWSSADPMAWIPSRSPGDGIRIALAHGSLDLPHFQGQVQHPIPRDAAARYQLDYVALGDWHSTFNQTNLAYPGSPELTAPDDRDAGNVLLVEISAPNTPLVISPLRSGQISKVAIERSVNSRADLEDLREELEKINSSTTVLLLTINGTVSIGDFSIYNHIKELSEKEFVWSKIVDSALLPGAAPPDLPAYFPEVAERLLELAASTSTESAAASLALQQLNAGAVETGQ